VSVGADIAAPDHFAPFRRFGLDENIELPTGMAARNGTLIKKLPCYFGGF